MKNKHTKCLLLNADYTPITIISWKRAMVWYFKYSQNHKYSIDILDFYKDDSIIGVNKHYPIPAVAKTNKYFKFNKQTVSFSRKNLFIRDNYTCQYCYKKFSISELTYDHVIPKSTWSDKNASPTCWTNIVTACTYCNRKKGNRTPKQANMQLMTLPVQPSKNIKYLPLAQDLSKIRQDIPKEWEAYLPSSYI